MDEFARRTGLTATVIGTLLALALMLVVGSVVRLSRIRLPSVSRQERSQRLGSLATWWVLFALLAVITLVGVLAAVAIFAAISFLGLREFRVLAQPRIAPVRLWWPLTYL